MSLILSGSDGITAGGTNISVSELQQLDGLQQNVQNRLDNVISVPAAYHIYNGQLALANSVTTTGFSTTLYTGNGSTQSVTTGVDMDTQWGNDASEKFGGLVWQKYRSIIGDNTLVDSVRGAGKYISSNTTGVQGTDNNSLSSFSYNGFNIGTSWSSNLATASSWNFQTTHRVSGVTNHGKAFTCHYNPFTGFTIVKYEGSGIAGHEIPHYLGRKLGFATVKNLGVVTDWQAYTDNGVMMLNLTNALTVTNAAHTFTDTYFVNNNGGNANNASTNQYIMYGWANSYFDEKNTLIGNYDIGVYQGTGVAGNKINIRGKPAWVMVKRLDTTANWLLQDNMRGDKDLYTNLSNAETSVDLTDFVQDGFVLKSTIGDCNASGGQYLYMVVYDNDSGSGKSKYPRATDTSTLNLNAHVPFANGIDTTGSKVSIAYKNETITLSNSLTQGKNYIALLNNGTYVASPSSPNYGSYNGFGDYFDLNSQKWFNNITVFSDNCNLTTNWVADEANGSTPVASISSINGEIKIQNTGAVYGAIRTTFNTVVGKKYRLLFTITSSSAYVTASLGTTARGSEIGSAGGVVAGGSGSFVKDFVASTSTTHFMLYQGNTNGAIFTIDNVCLYSINADGSVDTSSASVITPRNYLDCIVYADQNGQPEYVEQLPKTTYFDKVSIQNGFDLNQKWVDVKNSRLLGVTYTNSTNKPMPVSILLDAATAGSTFGLIINGLIVANLTISTNSGDSSLFGIVPNGGTYSVSQVYLTGGTITGWLELR